MEVTKSYAKKLFLNNIFTKSNIIHALLQSSRDMENQNREL